MLWLFLVPFNSLERMACLNNVLKYGNICHCRNKRMTFGDLKIIWNMDGKNGKQRRTHTHIWGRYLASWVLHIIQSASPPPPSHWTKPKPEKSKPKIGIFFVQPERTMESDLKPEKIFMKVENCYLNRKRTIQNWKRYSCEASPHK